MEDRPRSHRGLPATVDAHPPGLRGPPVPTRLTRRAHEPLRPTQARQVVQARRVVREPGQQLLKRWLTGTLHYAASQDHLGYYLDEYTFRFNRRTSKARGLLFYRLLQQAVGTDPHPLKDLLKPSESDDFT